MKTIYSILALAAAFALAGCQKDSTVIVEEPTDFLVEVSISDNGFTLDSGDKFMPKFNKGEKAGLFVVNGGGRDSSRQY